jgi:hypothetical protein
MAESVTYGSYTFPEPTPLVGQGVEPVYAEGKIDHYIDSIEIVGNLTGSNLSGIHLQKMQMISGLMSEFNSLTITHEDTTTGFHFTTPESINFSDSNMTTVLPYAVQFSSRSSGSFSKFYRVTEPTDSWTFVEEGNRITNATHTVRAKGVKVDATSALVNARHFVTGRATGFADISLFQTGRVGVGSAPVAFLISRNEEVNRSASSYAITENYQYDTSENPVTDSGVFRNETQISYNKDAGLSVRVNASIQGSMDANKGGTGLLHTGVFTSGQAAEIAINAVVSSLSDFETGTYTFIQRGPTSTSYNIDTGANKIDFSFTFDNQELDQEGNVLHTRSATVATSKDQSIVTVSVRGNLKYNTTFDMFGTGDPATGERFKEVDARYSGVIENSGLFNMALEAFKYFREDATGYHISGDYLNPTFIERSVNKTPADSTIGYSAQFNNSVDLSSGTLSGLKVSITDKKPLEVSGIVESLGGFAKQKIANRTAGEYQVSANCEADTGDIQTLKDVVSGHLTGIYTFSENSSVDDQTISYNISRFY